MDAAHFVHQAFLGHVWSNEPLFIPTPSGRNRYNVLGALNAVTKEVVTIENDKYINSESVCQLLYKLSIRKTLNKSITVVLDNARYQRCTFVKEYAEKVDIELLFLPTYSPNLNLIERFWKYVKGTCLYSKYYETFNTFKNTIANCIRNQTTEKMQKLKTLLTCKFQSFKNVKLLT